MAAGGFALHWNAHGLRYGIPAAIDADLEEGRDVIFNGSRAVLPLAHKVYPTLAILHVTATPATLAGRLAARGRESAEEIEKRLARANYDIAPDLPVREIRNDGRLRRPLQPSSPPFSPKARSDEGNGNDRPHPRRKGTGQAR